VEIRSLRVLLYILTVSRDSVVNGPNFHLIHSGLIPDGTIRASGAVGDIWLKFLLCNINCATLLYCTIVPFTIVLMCTPEPSLAKSVLCKTPQHIISLSTQTMCSLVASFSFSVFPGFQAEYMIPYQHDYPIYCP